MTNDSTKQRILLTAGPIFARKGFGKTTVREICHAAGVNVASINYYFGDKEKLYAEAILLAEKLQEERSPRPIFEPHTPPEEKLRRIVDTFLRRIVAMQSEPWQVRLIMREVLQPTSASDGLLETYFRPFFEMLLEVVEELFGSQLPLGLRQQVGVSIIGQCMIYRTSAEMMMRMLKPTDASYFQLDSLTQHITQFSLAAIAGMRQSHIEANSHNYLQSDLQSHA